MARILLIDDAVALAQLFGEEIRRTLGHETVLVTQVADVADTVRDAGPFDLAVVDLSFPHERATGLDALVVVHDLQPDARLVVLTQGDEWVADTLRDAWELLPLATVMSKSSPLELQLRTIAAVLDGAAVRPDPTVQPLLPAGPSGGRQHLDFRRLVPHNGHAKFWSALLSESGDASYRSIASATGLKLNTVKNYRAQLLPLLADHGLVDASLRDMQQFAHRCRSFLRPHLDRGAVGEDVS